MFQVQVGVVQIPICAGNGEGREELEECIGEVSGHGGVWMEGRQKRRRSEGVNEK